MPSGARGPQPGFRDHFLSLRIRPGCLRMPDRLVDEALRATPDICAPVQRLRNAGLAMLELDAQQLREELMEAVPLAVLVQRQQEEIRLRQLPQQLFRLLR